jgi:hypothetical protein
LGGKIAGCHDCFTTGVADAAVEDVKRHQPRRRVVVSAKVAGKFRLY